MTYEDPFAVVTPTDVPIQFAVPFTTMLVTSRVGIDPSGKIWQYQGTAGMVQIGTMPVNTLAPSITGTTVHGNVLSCATGNWTTGGTYAYQWYSGANPVGTNSASYTTGVGDVGNMITCVVTLTSPVGGSGFATSNALGPIT